MSRLFKYSSAITLVQAAEKSLTGLLSTTAVTVSDLRTRFTVDKNLGKEPNTCTVVISNFAEKSRAEAQKSPLHVIVEAGYDGDNARLFAGDVLFAQSKKVGIDWETELQLGDGSRTFRRARSNRSFKRGVKAKRAVFDIIKDMELTPPSTLNELAELDNEFAAGVAVEGSSQRELTRILSAFNLDWSIQDGRLQVLRKDDARKDAPHVISQDTGMIGVPEYGSPEKKGKPPTLHVETLLFPRLVPGGKIDMQSDQIRGIFKVTRVLHTGDTHGADWMSRIEAVPV